MAIRPHHHPMHEQPGSKSLQPIWITHDWVSTEHVKKQLTLLLTKYMLCIYYVHYNTMKEWKSGYSITFTFTINLYYLG